MTHIPHDLAAEFPGKAERIHALKAADAHFARLVTDYDAVNRLIHRAEQRLELMSEEEEEHLRRRRVHLKDHIARHLR